MSITSTGLTWKMRIWSVSWPCSPFCRWRRLNAVRTLTDARLNMAKAVLAFEATKITHGEEAAVAACGRPPPSLWFETRRTRALSVQHVFPRSERTLWTIPAHPVPRKKVGRPWSRGYRPSNCSTRQSLLPPEERRNASSPKGAAMSMTVSLRPLTRIIGLGDVDERGEIRLRKGKKKHLIVLVR